MFIKIFIKLVLNFPVNKKSAPVCKQVLVALHRILRPCTCFNILMPFKPFLYYKVSHYEGKLVGRSNFYTRKRHIRIESNHRYTSNKIIFTTITFTPYTHRSANCYYTGLCSKSGRILCKRHNFQLYSISFVLGKTHWKIYKIIPTIQSLNGPLAWYVKLQVHMPWECRERFPRHRGLAIPTCITARASRTCRDACRDR